ncbi:MAG TPA: heavy-metal-associated domain-containing protein [Porticoccaceae bacterium]|nr:heavy-metal-associated domain-containing protein [Porticoccaceae bacterium]HIK80113.1 heavy-metal-associated domain-containing protein [Porticoccaceae bacterium]
MKKLLLLSLLLSSAAVHAGQHDMENMHSHEGHLHEAMIDGKEIVVDPKRFDIFVEDLKNNQIALVSVQGMVCDFCARGIEKTFGKDKSVIKVDVDLASGKVLLAYRATFKINLDDIKKKILDNGLNTTDIQIMGN